MGVCVCVCVCVCVAWFQVGNAVLLSFTSFMCLKTLLFSQVGWPCYVRNIGCTCVRACVSVCLCVSVYHLPVVRPPVLTPLTLSNHQCFAQVDDYGTL